MQSKVDIPIKLAANSIDNIYFQTNCAPTEDQRKNLLKQFKIQPNAIVFIFVGRLAEEKGVFDLFDAFSSLTDTQRKWHLLILGDGPLRSSLTEYMGEKKLTGFISFAGFIQKKELPNIYGISDVLVIPSRSEPWGLVVNEALACGLPVIASDKVGSARDLVTMDNGRIFESGNTHQLCEAIKEMLTTDITSMGKVSKKIIANYTPEIQAQQIVDALLNIPG